MMKYKCHNFILEFAALYTDGLLHRIQYLTFKHAFIFFNEIFVDQMNNPQSHDSAVAEEIAAPLQDGKAGSGVFRKIATSRNFHFQGLEQSPCSQTTRRFTS